LKPKDRGHTNKQYKFRKQ